MNDWSSPWAAASNSNRSTPRAEIENPFTLTSSTALAPPDPAFLHKTSLHKPHDSVWSTFTNDESVWGDAIEDGNDGLQTDAWANQVPAAHNLDIVEPAIEEERYFEDHKSEPQSQLKSEDVARPESSDLAEKENVQSDQPDINPAAEVSESTESDEFDDFQSVSQDDFPKDEMDTTGSVSSETPATSTSIPEDNDGEQDPPKAAALQEEVPSEDGNVTPDARPDSPRSTRIDAYNFTFDVALYDQLFPKTTTEAKTEPVSQDTEMDDNIISSTSERKAWYRISREETMREHDNGSTDYIHVVWKDSAVQRKATKTVERWIHEYRTNVGSTLFSPVMKSGAAFNWSDKTETPHGRKPSISSIKTHQKKPSTQASTAPSTATARSSMHSDRGVGLGFSWSSERPSQDPPTPPSSAGWGKSPSTEFKSFKFDPVRGENGILRGSDLSQTPVEPAAQDAEEDYGDFEEFTSPVDSILAVSQHQTQGSRATNLSLRDKAMPKLSTAIARDSLDETGSSSPWKVMEMTTDSRRSVETPLRPEKTATFEHFESPVPQIPSAAINDTNSDPWGGLESFDQQNSIGKQHVAEEQFPNMTPISVPSLPPPKEHATAKDMTAIEIIQNLPDLAFMLR